MLTHFLQVCFAQARHGMMSMNIERDLQALLALAHSSGRDPIGWRINARCFQEVRLLIRYPSDAVGERTLLGLPFKISNPGEAYGVALHFDEARWKAVRGIADPPRSAPKTSKGRPMQPQSD